MKNQELHNAAVNLAMEVYVNEPCRICGELVKLEDLGRLVFAGYSATNYSRAAHGKCWEQEKPKSEWAYPEDAIPLTKVTRTKLLDISWFHKSQKLAIADVVYVHGIGLCSHQPDKKAPFVAGQHRLLDMDENYHIVTDNSLFFLVTQEEEREYWKAVDT